MNNNCMSCGKEELKRNPHYKDKEIELCLDCAYEYNFIDKNNYIKLGFYSFKFDDLANYDVVLKGSTEYKHFVSSIVSKYEIVDIRKSIYGDYRNNKEYREWRKKVFERDKYTCNNCNTIGGILNAHHIKKYKNFPKLRYEVNNGITLCESCHRLEHKKLRGEKNTRLD